VWCFNFNLRLAARRHLPDTTGFSRVVLNSTYAWPRDDTSRTPPTSAVWCFSFNLRHGLASPDTTGFSHARGCHLG